MEYQFKTNIQCGSCVAAVTPVLNNEEKISEWKVDISNPQKTLSVKTDSLTAEELKALVAKAGYRAELIA